MDTPSRPTFHAKLDPSLSRIGRALVGGNLVSLSKAVCACKGLWDAVLQKLTTTLDAELIQLCKRNTNPPSLFRRMTIDRLPQFKWSDCIAELQAKAPITLQLVTALVSANDSRNKQKCRDAHFPGICMIIATLLKERNREMCGIQTLLSLILFSSRVQKQVNYSIIIHVHECRRERRVLLTFTMWAPVY